eukprot:364355-Chlamydomonas_euryale.AAC.6
MCSRTAGSPATRAAGRLGVQPHAQRLGSTSYSHMCSSLVEPVTVQLHMKRSESKLLQGVESRGSRVKGSRV